MSAPSTHEPNDLGGGWFDAPGLDLENFEDPLQDTERASFGTAPPNPMGDPRGADAYWESVSTAPGPANRRVRRDLVGARMGRRFLANIIDSIVVQILSLPILIFGLLAALSTTDVATNQTSLNYGVLAVIGVLAIFINMAYFVGGEAAFGTSVGKLVLGMRVVDQTGHKPTVGESLIRNGWRILSGFAGVVAQSGAVYAPLGALAAIALAISIGGSASGISRQAWNDRLAACFVINKHAF